MQKHGHLANDIPWAQNFTCRICKTSPVVWSWSDKHGEAMCTVCGTPYQLLQYKDKELLRDVQPVINIKESWIPILLKYWDETNKFTGFGIIMLSRDYQECVEGQRKFYDWLDEHSELIPED